MMWKFALMAAATVFVSSGCLDPGCMRNSECSYGLECRANKCQKPLPAPQVVAGQGAPQCYAYWCPYVQDGGTIHYGGSGGQAATSTRYQDGGTSTSTGASGMDVSSTTGSGGDTSGAGGSM